MFLRLSDNFHIRSYHSYWNIGYTNFVQSLVSPTNLYKHWSLLLQHLFSKSHSPTLSKPISIRCCIISVAILLRDETEQMWRKCYLSAVGMNKTLTRISINLISVHQWCKSSAPAVGSQRKQYKNSINHIGRLGVLRNKTIVWSGCVHSGVELTSSGFWLIKWPSTHPPYSCHQSTYIHRQTIVLLFAHYIHASNAHTFTEKHRRSTHPPYSCYQCAYLHQQNLDVLFSAGY